MSLCAALGLDLATEIEVEENISLATDIQPLVIDFSSRPEYQLLEQNGYAYKTEITGNSPMLMATLSVPLWHWGKELNKVKRARLNYANAQLDLRKSTRLLAIENQQALHNLQDSRQMITTAQVGLCLSEDNLRYLRLRYDNAMATLTDLLDAYSQWQEARSNLIEAQTQYKIHEMEYRRVTGLL